MSLACQFSERTQTSPSNLNYYTKKLLHSLSGNSGRKAMKKDQSETFYNVKFLWSSFGTLACSQFCVFC